MHALKNRDSFFPSRNYPAFTCMQLSFAYLNAIILSFHACLQETLIAARKHNHLVADGFPSRQKGI
jgi:hypothetical protein